MIADINQLSLRETTRSIDIFLPYSLSMLYYSIIQNDCWCVRDEVTDHVSSGERVAREVRETVISCVFIAPDLSTGTVYPAASSKCLLHRILST